MTHTAPTNGYGIMSDGMLTIPDELVTQGWPVTPASVVTPESSATRWPPAVTIHCSPVAFDIVKFNDPRRDDQDLLYVRERLYGILAEAFAAAGIPWPARPREDRPEGVLFRQDRGDGVVIVVPPVTPIVAFFDPLVDEIRAALRRHNKHSAAGAQIGLRMAVATGTVHFDPHGMIGHTLTRLFDLLEAPAFKSEFTPGTYFGVITSDYVYQDTIQHGPESIEPELYQPVDVRTNDRCHRAWTYFPGKASAAATHAAATYAAATHAATYAAASEAASSAAATNLEAVS